MSNRPFRILVLGDFSGRASRAVHAPEDLDRRRIHAVDRDDLDEVFARLAVRVRIPTKSGAEPIELAFEELDQIHPDHLFANVPAFAQLRGLRRRLEDPQSFAAAAAELGHGPVVAQKREATPTLTMQDLLSATTQAAQRPRSPAGTGSELVDALLREIVIPHVTPAPDPRLGELLASVDAATSAHMRSLMHHDHVRELEAAWLGLKFIVRRLETDSSLQIHLLDVARAELQADFDTAKEPTRSRLWKRLVESTVDTPGSDAWAAIVCATSFDASAESADLLAHLARLASAAGATLLAGGNSRLVGCEALATSADPDDWTRPLDADPARAWQALRALPQAQSVCLTLPRILLRLPYGAGAGTVERFTFEELANSDDHEGYRWGSGAFAACLLLGTEFSRNGRPVQSDVTIEIEDMPADVRERDGESSLMPCAEVLLTERAADRLIACGLTPLRSIRGRDALRIGPLRFFGTA